MEPSFDVDNSACLVPREKKKKSAEGGGGGSVRSHRSLRSMKKVAENAERWNIIASILQDTSSASLPKHVAGDVLLKVACEFGISREQVIEVPQSKELLIRRSTNILFNLHAPGVQDLG